MSAFLQPNNYFEAGISVLDPTVEGKEAGVSATRRNISDMGNDYYFPNAALKLQLSDKFSLAYFTINLLELTLNIVVKTYLFLTHLILF